VLKLRRKTTEAEKAGIAKELENYEEIVSELVKKK
jgi:hypothetical protein